MRKQSTAGGAIFVCVSILQIIVLASGCQGPASATAADWRESEADDADSSLTLTGNDDDSDQLSDAGSIGFGTDPYVELLGPAGLGGFDPDPFGTGSSTGDPLQPERSFIELGSSLSTCPVTFEVLGPDETPSTVIRAADSFLVTARVVSSAAIEDWPDLIYVWRFDNTEQSGLAGTHLLQSYRFDSIGRHDITLAVRDPLNDAEYECSNALDGGSVVRVFISSSIRGSISNPAPPACLTDAECNDGSFCNGFERCISGNCTSGPVPCPDQDCERESQTCADCFTIEYCDDGLFCNGWELCVAGTCQAGTDPCGGGLCDDGLDQCVDCLTDSDCDDGSFCNGSETCDSGSCIAGSSPCGGAETCNETTNDCEPSAGYVVTGLPMNLQGPPPESSTAFLTLNSIPPGATAVQLTMTAFDADNNEGRLFINGFGPIQLFGSAWIEENDGASATLAPISTPIAWYHTGSNTLAFWHDSTGGFIIQNLTLTFDTGSGGCISNAECNDGNACTSDQCSAGICSNTAIQCGSQLCDPASGACVDCLSNSDCGLGETCAGNRTCQPTLSGTLLSGIAFRGDDLTPATGRTVTIQVVRASNGQVVASTSTVTGLFSVSIPLSEFSGIPARLDAVLRIAGTANERTTPVNVQMTSGVPATKNLTVFYDFFVDQDGLGGPVGVNSNSGTQASPLLTIQSAADRVFPGDRVFIRGGTYTTNNIPFGTQEAVPVLNVLRGGTATRPVLFEAWDGELVILDSLNRQRNGADVRANYVTLSKLTFINAKRVGARIISDYRTSGSNQPTNSPPVYTGTPAGVEVIGSKLVECVAYDNSLAPTGFEPGFQIIGQCRDCSIDFCASYRNGQGITLREASSVNYFREWPLFQNPWPDAPRNCTVRGCLVFDNRRNDENTDGIGGRYLTDCTMVDNVAFGNVDDNFDTVSPSRCVWEGNVAFDSNPDRTLDGDGNGLKICTREGGGNIVRNNIAFLNPRGGFDDDDGSQNQYFNNVAYGNNYGMIIESDVGPSSLQNNLSFNNTTRDVTLSQDCPSAPPFAPNPTNFNYWGDGKPPFNPCNANQPFGDLNSLSSSNAGEGLNPVGIPLFVNPINSVSQLDLGAVDDVREGTGHIQPGAVQTLVDSILTQVRSAFALRSVAGGFAADSPCIDAGDDVGLPFNGAFPDIGAVETP